MHLIFIQLLSFPRRRESRKMTESDFSRDYHIFRAMKKRFVLKLIAYMACAIISMVVFDLIAAKTHLMAAGADNSETECEPTPSDYLGPFYKADAPIRSIIGKGYELTGRVMSSASCAPIPHARIELWLANPDGSYDDNHRATIFADETGKYKFESNFPPGYYGRPPHIHIRISAEGFETLVTQHYPTDGQTTGKFDIVLVPKR
jgi:protocatechuate 3,4-dioxygenase beta subunit